MQYNKIVIIAIRVIKYYVKYLLKNNQASLHIFPLGSSPSAANQVILHFIVTLQSVVYLNFDIAFFNKLSGTLFGYLENDSESSEMKFIIVLSALNLFKYCIVLKIASSKFIGSALFKTKIWLREGGDIKALY